MFLFARDLSKRGKAACGYPIIRSALVAAELAEWIAPRFRRIEARQRARSYLGGLLAPLERKNGWQLAEAAGMPPAAAGLPVRMRWDADALRDVVRDYALETLAEGDAVLVIDETGFLKKGTASVGVARQYSGSAGKIDEL